jgi:sec-independent protein translocase protein TatA
MVLAAGPFGLGFPELLIILVVVLLIFGASRLADLGGALGTSIREFRRAANDPEDADATKSATATTSDAPATAGIHCAKCGAEIENRDVKFCPSCGSAVQAAV